MGKGGTSMTDMKTKVRKIRELLSCEIEMKKVKFSEAFISLRAALEKAISYKFGQDAFTHDFSTKEVIIGYNSSDIHPLSSWESGEYEKTTYKIDGKGNVTFTGPISKVTKKVTFENRTPQDWLDLRRVEAGLKKEAEETEKICRICKAIK